MATTVGAQLRFSRDAYTVSEAAGTVILTVERTGDASGTASVLYRTVSPARLFNCDPSTEGQTQGAERGVASPRCDYATAVGRLRFAPGETSKTLAVIITNDTFTEGAETFLVRLLDPRGAQLIAQQSIAPVTIADDETTGGAAKTNPADALEFFAGQQYVDFFGRQASEAEVANWRRAISEVCIRQTNGEECYDRIWLAGKGFFGSR